MFWITENYSKLVRVSHLRLTQVQHKSVKYFFAQVIIQILRFHSMQGCSLIRWELVVLWFFEDKVKFVSAELEGVQNYR